MKKKKRNFDARFWSGTKKHSALQLLEAFFQFNDLAIVKEALSAMMQCSVRENTRITDYPAEVFHLYQSLRSLVRAGEVIADKAGKGPVCSPSEAGASEILLHSLPEEEYRDPVSVFRRAFKACRREELEDFLATVTYFSLGEFRCEEEKKLVVPYIHLMKMLDAAWLIVKRTSGGKLLTPKAHKI